MSFNGSGVFQINSTGQPVVASTLIESATFNALTADLATGLSTCITKDGQTTPTANIPMGGYRITGLGFGTTSTDAARMDNANSHICEFRLTLTTGVPVTTSDVTAAETLYCTPYKGNSIALYSGTAWVMRTSAEMSIDIPDVTGVHDVFCYDNSGTPTLEVLVWTNETTRATGLTLQNGVLVKSGDATRRYLGTFYSTTAGNGQTEDSVANRYLWNYYNRVLRPMRVLEGTDTWNYTTATIRQANGSTANQLNFVIGVSEDLVSAETYVAVRNTAANVLVASGIGQDSTTAFATGLIFPRAVTAVAAQDQQATSSLKTFPGVGKRYLAWLEYSAATGTTTWSGDAGAATLNQSGIHGQLWG